MAHEPNKSPHPSDGSTLIPDPPDLIIDPDVDTASGQPIHLRFRYIYVVFVGGVLGTLARWSVADVTPTGHQWPWATFLVNLLGAFALGLLLETLSRMGTDHGWRRLARLHFGTGFLGAFTTYSSFAVEATLLLDQRHTLMAVAYLLASAVLGVSSAWLGVVMGARRTPAKVVPA